MPPRPYLHQILTQEEKMGDSVPDSYGAMVAAKARDRLWCLAACEVLSIEAIAKLTRRVNELRNEQQDVDEDRTKI